MLITVLRVSRSCELFPDGFDLHLLRSIGRTLSDRPAGAARKQVKSTNATFVLNVFRRIDEMLVGMARAHMARLRSSLNAPQM